MMDAVPLARAIRGVSLAGMALAMVVPALPALSQNTVAETRLRKMEAEIRALQRKVFPGSDGRVFQPEIAQPGAAGAAGAAGQPATTAVTDLLARMDAFEAQLARLTAQIEQNSNRIAQLEAGAASSPATATVAAPAQASANPDPASQTNLAAMTGGASRPVASATPAPVEARPSSDRVRAVSAIVKPQTEDAGEDEYTYGFRLWEAKFYPEAQQQLKLFLEKHPRHRRASWGRNLLGRAYLDAGDPREAAKWFLQNYQADKSAARAPDSLLYLASSMRRLGDTKRACIALAEFSETYAGEAAGRLKGEYDATRNGLNCSG